MTTSSTGNPPRIWIGRWLLGVAALHTLFAFAAYGGVLAGMGERGFIDSVGADPLRGAVAWFVLFGGGLALFAMAVSPLERLGSQTPALRRLGWGLLALTTLGIALMPASGFWLALPPAIALIRARG